MVGTVLLGQILQAILGDGDAGMLLVHKKTGQLLQRDVKDAEMRSSVSQTVFPLYVFCLAGVSFFLLDCIHFCRCVR